MSGVCERTAELGLGPKIYYCRLKLLLADSTDLQKCNMFYFVGGSKELSTPPVNSITKINSITGSNRQYLSYLLSTCSPSPEVPDLDEIVRHVAPSVAAAPAPEATPPRTTHA